MARLGEARRGRGGEGWPVGSGWNGDADDDAATVHGTQKPVECMLRPILNNSVRGDAVYEPFAGSGTTIIAAEKSGRRCFGMEIDPRYCDVIVSLGENLAIGGLFTLASPAGVRLPAGGGHDLGDGRPLRTAQHVDQQRLLGALARAPGGLTWAGPLGSGRRLHRDPHGLRRRRCRDQGAARLRRQGDRLAGSLQERRHRSVSVYSRGSQRSLALM